MQIELKENYNQGYNQEKTSEQKKDKSEEQLAMPQLTEEEKKALKKLSFFSLFRYSSSFDKILMIIGALAGIANGLSLPLFSLIFGEMTDSFSPDKSADSVVYQAGWNAIWFLVIGAGSFFLSWVQMITWIMTGERQAIKFRIEYFRAIIKQEIGWFDMINPNELASKVAQESAAISGAIGEKVPTFLFTIFTCIGGFFVAFLRGWLHSLVTTATIPGLAIGGFIFTYVLQNMNIMNSQAYAYAGGRAEQAINAIKTVKSLGGEQFEQVNYSKSLFQAWKLTIKYSLLVGFSLGIIYLLQFADYALCFWYGSVLIENNTINDNMNRVYTSGDVVTIYLSIIMGGLSIGQATPCLKNFAIGKQAALKIFQIIDRVPKINVDNKNGQTVQNLQGQIQFNNVKFSYPAKPGQQVIKGLSLTILPNQKTSFVGESGSGKSTIMQLIERFYDPDDGFVTIDGIDIKNYNLNWLRQNIGYVGQEPVLFAATIRENLRFGKVDATEEEMIAALKQANAWKFVQLFSKKLDTFVGHSGNQLSGGQKQRLCIARAILKNPKILLLDEATSALDRKNERMIQETLDQICEGRTTICIAHRLSTVQNSQKIYVLDQGVVIEEGTHNDLIHNGGKYEALCKNQMHAEEEDNNNKMSPNKANTISQVVNKENQFFNEINLDFDEDINENVNIYNDIKQRNIKQSQNQENIQYINDDKNIIESNIIIENKEKQIKENIIENQNKQIQLTNAYNERKLLQTQEEANKLINNQMINKQEQEDIVEERDFQKEEEDEKKKKIEQEKLIIKEKQKLESQVMSKLLALNKPERIWFMLGLLSAAINGLAYPLIGLFLSNMMTILLDYQDPEFRQKSNAYCLWFLLIGIVTLIVNMTQFYFFSIVGESLTLRIRRMIFEKIMKMPISFFDNPKNNPGTLSSMLATDAQLINQLTSTIISINFQNISTFICGMIIAFYASWKITLISLAISPLMLIAGQVQAQFMQGFTGLSDEEYKESGQVIMESVCNIRTVASFAQETFLVNLLDAKMIKPQQLLFKKGNLAGLSFGFSNFVIFGLFSVVFYAGAIFYRDDGLPPLDMFTSIFAIMYAAMGAGNGNMFMGDVGKAKHSAVNLFQILDQEDELQIAEKRVCTKQIQTNNIIGNIEFRNVSFRYPQREKQVLQDISFKIDSGTKVAFVGPSGCGKSTIMQLLLRFYEVEQGEILIDGINIRDYHLKSLRETFGVVQQEPVLFNASIRDNIKYNFQQIEDSNLKQTDEVNDLIKLAAQQANALGFIENNQFQITQNVNDSKVGCGFDRQVGPKGSQISGGQKQRIAIARAILKQPKVLILDEATSALDTENETIVQESLNHIMKGKTSLCIAHRISTIKDSNQIYVIEGGKIVEQGNYNELVEKKNYFYRLERGEN